MENKIKEVNNYFKGKVINNEYEVLFIDAYTIQINIDELYIFALWIGNGKEALGTRNCMYDSFMSLKFTQEEREEAWVYIKKHIDELYGKLKEEEEKREFERLKQKYEAK
jgi:hypothetical protein